jgi:hypothetical protein
MTDKGEYDVIEINGEHLLKLSEIGTQNSDLLKDIFIFLQDYVRKDEEVAPTSLFAPPYDDECFFHRHAPGDTCSSRGGISLQ